MNAIIMKKIEGTIRSLAASTKLAVETEKWSLAQEGLNSPYISHRSLSVGAGDCRLQEAILLQNDKGSLLISWSDPHPEALTLLDEKYRGMFSLYTEGFIPGETEAYSMRLPVEIFREVFERLPEMFRKILLPNLSWVTVTIVEAKFEGFDEDGRPQYSLLRPEEPEKGDLHQVALE